MTQVKNFITILFIAILVAFAFQGKRGLYSPDEGRYTECAREMNITHNYLLPELNKQLHISKPPITYWFLAISLKLFGHNEFAARFPNSLFFVLTVLLIFFIGKNIWNEDIATLSAVIYSTSIFPFIGLNFITTDTILTFFIWLYIFFFIKENYFLMWLAMGFAFLTKGPPSLLPFLAILLFLLFKNKEKIKNILNFKNLFIFLVVGLSWYIIVILKYPAAFDYFIKNELIGRVLGHHHRNSGLFDWIIYIPVLLFGLLPWSFYWYKINFKNLKLDNYAILLLYIIFIPFIIFCIVRSRLPLYILPLFPAISLLSAYLFQQINLKFSKKFLILSLVFLICLRIIFCYIPVSKNEKLIYKEIKPFIHGNNYKLNLVASRNHFGLNFYFNTIIEHLNLNNKSKLNEYAKYSITDKLKKLQLTNYFIIFDNFKLNYFLKLLKEKYNYSFKVFHPDNIYIVRVTPVAANQKK